ncbi:hypothetical protein [Streptacidiphilus anmyonensis]|uniref:hypothetical protein n=1 Tax=Streptacidiphilus anmyonensis TaxID=405782 RepID=UPI0005A71007|nr:hypothetical protein [Streptacidiphilus anmyonensis]
MNSMTDALCTPGPTLEQRAAADALLALMSPFIGAPGAMFDVDPSWRITVHVHDPAGFEWWREALGLDHTEVGELETYQDYCAARIYGQSGLVSTEVCLIGYLPLPAERPDTSSDAA